MNKNAERYYVEQLQKHYPGYLPEGLPRDSEEPDFLLDHEGTVVGLEVTQLFKAGSAPFPEKQVIAFQRKAVTLAGEIHRQLHPDRPMLRTFYPEKELLPDRLAIGNRLRPQTISCP